MVKTLVQIKEELYESYVILNKLTGAVHSEHPSKKDAYNRLIDDMRYNPNYTVLSKADALSGNHPYKKAEPKFNLSME